MTALFDIEALSDAVNARAAWLKPHLPVEAAAQMEEGLAWVHQFLASRPAEVQAELDQGGVSWNPPLRDVLCMHKRGTLEATYETVWGSLHTQDPMVAGAATFAGTLDGEPLEFDQLGAASNVGEGEAADKAMVAVFGRKGAVEMKILVLQTPLANFLPQSVIPIDWEMGMASLMKMRMQQDSAPQHVGFLSDALWVVDEAGQTPGAPVSGSVSGTLYSWDK